MSNNEAPTGSTPRKRSLTSITLGWIADRIKRTEQIKKKLADGEYKVESEKIAASILNEQK